MTRNLWAPWRISYLEQLTDTAAPSADEKCFLCDAVSGARTPESMEQRLVLLNDGRGVVLLNRFPYTNGHLLVAPSVHVGDLSDLSGEQRHTLMDLTDLATRVLKNAVNPQGINVGMNLGRCAGAGVPGHVHLHVVPRWHGDVNFMDVVGGVRVIPQALARSYERLRDALDSAV